jgi:CHAT domain
MRSGRAPPQSAIMAPAAIWCSREAGSSTAASGHRRDGRCKWSSKTDTIRDWSLFRNCRDGYLSASEIAALKLDADWVILSACNTAAGGAQGAEALSGLARAFFYAGARALLVSHWSVDSVATTKLISSAVGATARDKTLGRAEALRRAMVAMIDNGEAREAHPTYWAPFVVVGEGAAGIVTTSASAPVAAESTPLRRKQLLLKRDQRLTRQTGRRASLRGSEQDHDRIVTWRAEL